MVFARWIESHFVTILCVKGGEYKAVVGRLDQSITVPSLRVGRDNAPAIEDDMYPEKSSLKKSFSKMTLTDNWWSYYMYQRYMSAIAHWIDEK